MDDVAAETVFVIDLHDRPGVLAKIANIFYRRGLNIRRLTVGPTAEPARARMTVGVVGPRSVLERVAAAIDNLIDVLAVEAMPGRAGDGGASLPAGGFVRNSPRPDHAIPDVPE